jgi:hypothetical protein
MKFICQTNDVLYKYNFEICKKEKVCFISGNYFADIVFHPDGR